MKSKQELREQIWDELQRAGVDRFPGAQGRIPNFKGSEAAANRLAREEIWQRAGTLKSNPDSPQRPVRERALREGKRVYMAVPRLRERKCFLELDPNRLAGDQVRRASTIRGSSELGRPVGLKEMPALDLIVAGSVAVDRQGRRIGKGGGYSDLEYALAWEAGLIGADTPVGTTVHAIQVRARPLPQATHDLRLSWIVTPEEVIHCGATSQGSVGIHWDLLDEERIEAIPVLRERQRRLGQEGADDG